MKVRSSPDKRQTTTKTRELAGTVAKTGDIVSVKESSSNVEQNGHGGKIKHERWTGT